MATFVNPTVEYESTRRFSKRVADYVRYRPHYPQEVIDILAAEAGLTPASVIADIGSGTGFSTELYLKFGCPAFGVEPNPDMRAAGEAYLAGYPNFTSVDGTAEATTLPDGSVDFVTAGQAMHWFNLPEARREFVRILKPQGRFAFMWNERDGNASPMMAGYMEIVDKYLAEAHTAHHSDVDAARLAYLFADGVYETRQIAWSQPNTLEQLVGRLYSSSYMPDRDDPRAAALEEELTVIFNHHAKDGMVEFGYVTDLHFGNPARGEA